MDYSTATETEINEAVARKLGPNRKKYYETGDDDSMLQHPSQISFEVIPDYSHSIEAAWEVVEKGFIESVVRLEDGRYHAEPGDGAAINTYYEIGIYDPPHELSVDAIADTPARAICLAFLKLLENQA